MTHLPAAPDPNWQALLDQSDADDAFDELVARQDRSDDFTPCPALSTAAGQPSGASDPDGSLPARGARLGNGARPVLGKFQGHPGAESARVA